MKTFKMNLLEKEEMNAVRGGDKVNYHCIYCNCGCRVQNGVDGRIYVYTGENAYQFGFAVTIDPNIHPCDK